MGKQKTHYLKPTKAKITRRNFNKKTSIEWLIYIFNYTISSLVLTAGGQK
ncbi:Uncharacterised protein [Staphylococcus saprophyticus]|nr:Uncharacterised protein [Staphylococcus saprophyticus]